jgi:membrane protease YdiL (CAAX protease family)
MHLVDHLFVFLMLVIQPIQGALSYRRYLARVAAGEASDPVPIYRQTLALEWVAFSVLALTWLWLGRPFASLGFVAPGGSGFYASAIVLAVACSFLVHEWQRARRMSADERETQAVAIGDLVHFLPRNDRHFRHFFGLSITAGVVEETLYRGFIIWYLVQLMPLWAAIVVSSAVFGLGHSYQGVGGVLRVFLIGLCFGALYAISGSIWLPILGHAMLDILQGKALVEILRDRRIVGGKTATV